MPGGNTKNASINADLYFAIEALLARHPYLGRSVSQFVEGAGRSELARYLQMEQSHPVLQEELDAYIVQMKQVDEAEFGEDLERLARD